MIGMVKAELSIEDVENIIQCLQRESIQIEKVSCAKERSRRLVEISREVRRMSNKLRELNSLKRNAIVESREALALSRERIRKSRETMDMANVVEFTPR